MLKPFVVISGLPGSGKIDKDDILDRLFESKGIGDAAWRRTLSRESDVILQNDATNSDGAIVASFWHLRGMPSLDGESSFADVLASLRKLTQLPPLDIGQRIDVDASEEPNLTDVVHAIRNALKLLT